MPTCMHVSGPDLESGTLNHSATLTADDRFTINTAWLSILQNSLTELGKTQLAIYVR